MRHRAQPFLTVISSLIQKTTAGSILAALLTASITASLAVGEVSEQSRVAIDKIIGAKGTYFTDVTDQGVCKIVLPREAATIVYDDQRLSPNVGLNSWVAFSSAVHHEAILTGQLLLLQDEVDPVMTMALDAGLDITGLSDGSVSVDRAKAGLS